MQSHKRLMLKQTRTFITEVKIGSITSSLDDKIKFLNKLYISF